MNSQPDARQDYLAAAPDAQIADLDCGVAYVSGAAFLPR
jgi:hypothetical protein